MSENDLLSNAVDSMSNGVDNQREGIYLALNRALEGNASMMRVFDELMETSYITKVHLSSELKPTEDGSVYIDLTIQNATSFPIVSMTGEIEFVGPEIQYFTEDSLFKSPKTLNALTKTKESIRLISLTDKPMHGKGVVTIKHPHPSNGKMLEHKHSFGIYVIDQLTRTSVDKSELYKYGKKSYPVKFIRDILEIHPIKGIDIGMCIELSRKNFKVVCQVMQFSNDLECVELEFSSNEKETEVISRLTKELDALSS